MIVNSIGSVYLLSANCSHIATSSIVKSFSNIFVAAYKSFNRKYFDYSRLSFAKSFYGNVFPNICIACLVVPFFLFNSYVGIGLKLIFTAIMTMEKLIEFNDDAPCALSYRILKGILIIIYAICVFLANALGSVWYANIAISIDVAMCFLLCFVRNKFVNKECKIILGDEDKLPAISTRTSDLEVVEHKVPEEIFDKQRLENIKSTLVSYKASLESSLKEFNDTAITAFDQVKTNISNDRDNLISFGLDVDKFLMSKTNEMRIVMDTVHSNCSNVFEALDASFLAVQETLDSGDFSEASEESCLFITASSLFKDANVVIDKANRDMFYIFQSMIFLIYQC